MLNLASLPRHTVPLRHGAQDEGPWSLARLIAIVRRRLFVIAAVTAVVLGLAVAYLVLAPARYTAAAGVVLDTRRSAAQPLSSEAASDMNVDLLVVESQIETVRSENVALAVIRKLKLDQDPEFVGSGPGLISSMLATLGLAGSGGETEAARRQKAVAAFKEALRVGRLGRSYVAEIAFTSLDPEKAALIANEIAAAYIGDQLGASADSARKASGWMEERIGELRQQAGEAFRAVESHAAENGRAGSDGDAQQAAINRRGQVKLRELEAQTYKAIYESLLNRYTQTLQQQSFPLTDARVVTQATPPLKRSSPRIGVTLFLALAAGCGLGVAAAFAREHLDRTIRARDQLERRLGVRTLGFVPRVGARRGRAKARGSAPSGGATLVGAGETGALVLFADGPQAGAAETLRGVNLALAHDGRSEDGRVVGITSALTSEGKTTLAFNLAVVAARSGKRTLLIDGNLRDPALMLALAPDGTLHFSDLLKGQAQLAASPAAREFGFHLVGETAIDETAHPADVLGSRAMKELLEAARARYDCVLVDLPAMLDHVDVAAAAKLFDAFVLVAEFGRTTFDDLDRALSSSPVVAERVVGVIVNKTDASAQLYP